MEETLQKILGKYNENSGNVISILQSVEESFGHIPEEAVNWFARKLGIPASRFFGIATFYSQFHLAPRGKNIISVCCGTACHIRGSEKLLNRLLFELDMPPGRETSPDMKFTVEKVGCIGACGIAPVTRLNKTILGNVTLMKLTEEISKLKAGE